MRRIKYTAAVFLVAVGLYLSLTWFFFGSPHPCGILEARLRPYVLERVREEFQRGLIKLGMQKRTREEHAETEKQIKKIYDAIEKVPRWALDDLHEYAWQRLTPAQCLWKAITESRQEAKDG